MEERPLAKRFRPLITIHGCEVFECDQGCRGDISSVVLPDGIGKVGLSAYKYCLHLTSVTMPNSVKVVGESAFEHCRSLSSLTLSNSLRIVGEKAFCDCIGLTSLTLPNSVQRLGFRAFTRCGGLTSLTLSNSLTLASEHQRSQIARVSCPSHCRPHCKVSLTLCSKGVGDLRPSHCRTQ